VKKVGKLDNIDPKSVFRFFEEISQIPRCSGKEEKISKYLVDFAKQNGFKFIQDDAHNVIIKKPGTSGYEKSPTVILQSHMDMVCTRTDLSAHDFDKDPIDLVIDGDTIKTNGTTLGADNGIGMAISLAVLASKDISHPPLEVIFTANEEEGLQGVAQLDTTNITGKTMINIDAEDEGIFFAGCAGGIRHVISLNIDWENASEGLIPHKITIGGLKGGHSGLDIEKGRGNSNILMGRFLHDLQSTIDFNLSEINGGIKMNIIPSKTESVILIDKKDSDKLKSKVETWNQIIKNEFISSDEKVNISLHEADMPKKVFSNQSLHDLIFVLMTIPNGVQTMSMDIKGLVESSTNLGIVSTTESVSFVSNIRSSKRSLKYHILNKMELIAKRIQADTLSDSEYPEWDYDPKSNIRELFVNTYKKLYNAEPEITAMHGGLECGFFKNNLKEIDIISFGPDIYNVHSPDETLDIKSVNRTWELLLHVLSELK
jgi:dipeptidase D